MYSILVTNELFHNGNVEAWKKIIQSYTTKYPGLQGLTSSTRVKGFMTSTPFSSGGR